MHIYSAELGLIKAQVEHTVDFTLHQRRPDVNMLIYSNV